MSESTPNNLASDIWSIADLLRGDFKQSQYGRIILPFALLKRLEGVLAPSKEAVVAKYDELQADGTVEAAQPSFLLKATDNLAFYNTSKLDLTKLGQADIKDNLENYIQGFSKSAYEIFEYFKFLEFVAALNDADLLYKIIQKVSTMDLSPQAITNHDMGLVFEELIRRFAESSNETAGEHFTPRDIVHLTTALIFTEDDNDLTEDGVVRTIYDPTCGTGGFLSEGMEYVHDLNPNAVLKTFGQELNPESYAICKADMLIKGQEVDNIKLGNTLSNDQIYNHKFDYMLSNPPFGVDWKKIESSIKDEHSLKGFDGRFGAGLPRVSDGSLLFLMHLISKLRDTKDGGGRIGIILNGSPLFTGGAGSGESEIRRYILEADLLETIVALPTDMFYNTGIATYIWVLSNKKTAERKGKVQLINAVNLYNKMRKSLGSKRNELNEEDMKLIIQTFGGFQAIEPTELADLGLNKATEQKSNRGRQSATAKIAAPKTFASKLFNSYEFGYRRITIERPLRMSYQFSDELIATLRFANKPLVAPMQWVYSEFGSNWSDDEICEHYGQLADQAIEIRAHIKSHFSELKEKQIKDLLSPELWHKQKQILLKAKQLQEIIGTAQSDDANKYDDVIKAACKTGNITLDANDKKQITNAVSWKNADAEKVIKKVHKNTAANPIYGLFDVIAVDGQSKVIEYKADGDLRDFENVSLDPSQSVNELNEAYFIKEVQPHVADAWIDPSKTDSKDQQVGIVGYEIPITRHFYEYVPPRDLKDIDNELDIVSKDIMQLLQEVHV